MYYDEILQKKVPIKFLLLISQVAHVGDSRATLVTRSHSQAAYKGKNLTEDHKPSNPQEKRRIERGGGRVIFDGFYNHRVFAANRMYPGLNMSRAFGDTVAHREAGLCAVPDTQEYVLNGEEEVGLLVCSDGVWEFLDAQAAATCVMGRLARGNVQSACEELSKRSWNSWMEDSENEISDDITACMVCLNKLFK